VPRAGELIVLIGPPAASPKWPAIAGGARRYLERYPSLRLETIAPTDNRPETLLRAADRALALNPKVVCMYVSDPRAASDAAEAVISHTTSLVTYGIELDVAGVFGHVREDLTGAAELLGKNIEQIVAGKRSYILLHRSGLNAATTHSYERFRTKARSFGSISQLEERNAADAEQPPIELIRAMFARFPNAGLVVTLEPTVWLTTPPAEVLGRNARFATVGASPALWGHLQTGSATALAGVLDGELGALAVELALAAITENHAAGKVRTAPAELVTRATLDDFAKRYAAAAGLELQELLSATSTQPMSPGDEPTGP
jgi:hypothetical protein